MKKECVAILEEWDGVCVLEQDNVCVCVCVFVREREGGEQDKAFFGICWHLRA
jgi:hypothetical protein